jgi:hypothetical protein|nr:MAG TPA: hypothetical protein [Caudoviricetes sp.]
MDISEVKKNLNKVVIYQPTKESEQKDYYLTGCTLRKDTETKKCFYQAEIKDIKANSIMIVGLSQVIAKDM